LEGAVRYILIMTFDDGTPPRRDWSQEDVARHVDALQHLEDELAVSGEFVERRDLALPGTGRVVRCDGANPPVVQEWPYDDGGHALASYWVIDVESDDRALEVAGELSAAPGRHGHPLQRPVEVRAEAPNPLS
jgi:hypothetical protein